MRSSSGSCQGKRYNTYTDADIDAVTDTDTDAATDADAAAVMAKVIVADTDTYSLILLNQI